jgi:rhomboid protease GluP
MLIFLLIVVGIAIAAMKPDRRKHLLQIAMAIAALLQRTATHKDPHDERYRAALRKRSAFAIVTPAVAALDVVVFACLIYAGGNATPDGLLGWGANFGPRTTNGEWWRLLTAMFVHGSALHLAVNVLALATLGAVLERLVGQAVFAGVFLAVGMLANVMTVRSAPVEVSMGASAGIAALYGLLAATLVWTPKGQSELTPPRARLRKLTAGAMPFVLYNLVSGAVPLGAEATALALGFACGLVLTKNIYAAWPGPRLVGATVGVVVVLAAGLAFPLRGLADVRPEIARVIETEDRTADTYKSAAALFNRGRMTPDQLSELISRKIVPELGTIDARLKALRNVPSEHRQMVADAEEFLKLRTESWRLRAEGLRKTDRVPTRDSGWEEPASDARWRRRAEAEYRANMNTLGKAEGAERASLEVLERLRQEKS